MEPMNPYVLLGFTLVSMGITTVAKLKDLWKDHAASDADLDAILAEVETRLARRA